MGKVKEYLLNNPDLYEQQLREEGYRLRKMEEEREAEELYLLCFPSEIPNVFIVEGRNLEEEPFRTAHK
jgi:hypothetical protein